MENSVSQDPAVAQAAEAPSPAKTVVEGAVFTSGEEAVDGKEYRRCTFDGVALVYAGGEQPAFVNCKFGEVTLQFTGSAADTLMFLSGMASGGFRQAVSKIADNIRGIKPPARPLPPPPKPKPPKPAPKKKPAPRTVARPVYRSTAPRRRV